MTTATVQHGQMEPASVPRPRPRRRRPGDRPYALPARPQPSWWDEPNMRIALARHGIAMVIRLLQERGMTQRSIAALVGTSQSEIAEILAGRKVRSYDLLTRFAQGLSVPLGYMGLAAVPLPCPRHVGRATAPARRPDSDATPAPTAVAWALPARWWNEPAMVSALATHNFATVLAFLNRHGIGVDEIAVALGVPVDELACVADGLSTLDSYRALHRLADWLAIPRGRLGLGSTSPDDPQAQPQLPLTWTGRHTRALRRALRHSVRDFAHLLDVTDRIVSKWEAAGDAISPRERIQERLDILLYRLDPAAQDVYHRLVSQRDSHTPVDGGIRAGHRGG